MPLAVLVAAGLLTAASRAADDPWKKITDVNPPAVQNKYTVNVPVPFYATSTGMVRAKATATCGHGTAPPQDNSKSGVYLTVSRQSGEKLTVTGQNMSVRADAAVKDAEGHASNEIRVDWTVRGNSVEVRTQTVIFALAKVKDCGDGTGHATAWANGMADPIVFGSQPYPSWSGLVCDPFPTDSDGLHRYVEPELSLMAGGSWTGGSAGLSPEIAADGSRCTNQVIVSQYVRAGSDDDPNNLAGAMIYQLRITRSPDGGLAVSWTPGTDTADFAFSFSQTQAQIEGGVAAYFDAGGATDLSLGTARITMLQDEATMPNMTLVAHETVEVWSWVTGNPTAFGGTERWWQAPDMSTGGFRPSSVAGGQVCADDFLCTGAASTAADGLRWWGTYAGEPGMHRPNMPYLEPFVIQWFASDGAPHPFSLPMPGPPLAGQLVQASRYFVNWAATGDAIYEFNARLNPAFVPPGPGEYFLNINATDPRWQWMTSADSYLDTPALSPSPAGPWIPNVFPDLSLVLVTAIAPDGDRDGDVDRDDFNFFFAPCFSGPAIAPGPSCSPYDFDADQDVDQADFGLFQRCFSGADAPADPDCLK
ncbi:MAG: hypothetical protein KA354_16735 [Phycisphaerae bacterium]|nr:hypothetical protein [Phycisphaerae bacterium]